MKKVVVTGATSMVGVALITELTNDNDVDIIYAVVRPHTEKWTRLPNDRRIIRVDCDIREYDKLPSLIADTCDCFFHLAWTRTPTYSESADDMIEKCEGIKGVILAVSAAKQLRCCKFIWAGGQSEYGLSEGVLGPDDQCNPVRADGMAHYAAGMMGRLLANSYGVLFIWMRVFSVYGRYDRCDSMISSTIRKLIKGEHCAFSPADQMWDYINAEDVGRAFAMVGRTVNESKIYCVGSGQERPLREYIETIRDIINPVAELGIGELPYSKDPIMRLCADNQSLIEDTGWKPRVSFREGIIKIIETGELE